MRSLARKSSCFPSFSLSVFVSSNEMWKVNILHLLRIELNERNRSRTPHKRFWKWSLNKYFIENILQLSSNWTPSYASQYKKKKTIIQQHHCSPIQCILTSKDRVKSWNFFTCVRPFVCLMRCLWISFHSSFGCAALLSFLFFMMMNILVVKKWKEIRCSEESLFFAFLIAMWETIGCAS